MDRYRRRRERDGDRRSDAPPGRRVAATLLSGALAFGAGTALAVDDGFELDGNALQDGLVLDDWELLVEGGGSSVAYTGVIPDASPQSIFGGGNKDIQDVSRWSHKSGSVPDKSDITNAYAAAYSDNGDLVVYFGADRVANAGDTFMGFWFFKQQISLNPDGSFEGTHTQDDVLVLVNFPQANNAVPLIQVVSWDESCNKADSNSPAPGDCAAANLRLLAGASGAGAVCGSGSTDGFCAITNEEGTANAAPGLLSGSPWPYTSKDGTSGQFPFETFFEGGINLSAVLGGEACFASFLAETRSSSSFTASLKDLAIGSFPVCSISVEKQCLAGDLTADETSIVYPIAGTVTNEGFGTVYDVTVTDVPSFDEGTLSFADGSVGTLASLAGGASMDFSATMTVPLGQNGTSDTVTAVAYTSPGGTGTALSASDTAICPPLSISPDLSVTKVCETVLTVLENPVVVAAQVNFSGSVCNIGDTTVSDVAVLDDKAGEVLSGVSLPPLDPNNPGAECVEYSGSYLPQEALDANENPTDDPGAAIFTDTVTATGVSLFGAPVTPAPISAECPLCP